MKKVWLRRMLVAGVASIAMVGMLAGCGSSSQKSENTTKYRVGMVQIVQHPALDDAVRGIIDGMKKAGLKEGVDFSVDAQNAQGDQSNLDTIIRRFIFDKNNLIFAIATPSAQAAANTTKDIPIVGTAITDYKVANLVHDAANPGTNVTGTSDKTDIVQQLDLIHQLTPTVRTLGVVYNSSEINSQLQVEELKTVAAERGLMVKEYTVSSVNDIPQVATQMAGEVDAIYIPTDNVVASALPALIAVTNEARVPVYGAESAHVQNGAVASLSVDFYSLGVRAGEMGAAILEGKAQPQTMAIEDPKDLTLIINEREANLLGITLPEDVKAKAKVVQ